MDTEKRNLDASADVIRLLATMDEKDFQRAKKRLKELMEMLLDT